MSGPTNGGRARAYRALRESEELHRATLESISDAVFLTDDDGVFTFICPNVDVIFGYAPDEVQAMQRIDRLFGEPAFDRLELAARGEIRNIERHVVSRSGDRRTVLVHLKSVSIQGGTVLYTCRDITEHRRIEHALRAARLELAHASRLALVGELLGSIAHEIKQPLAAILNNASAGLHQLNGAAQDWELRETFRDIQTDGRRTVEIIERLRSLMDKKPLERVAVDINAVVTEMGRLVEGDAERRHVTLEFDLGALPNVVADRVSLQQVVLNLLMNGMDAMDGLPADERRLNVRTRLGNDEVEVAVSDVGRGIPDEERARLFEPFYTTKPGGLGLGLSIARSIVEAHGGRITVGEHARRGTTFSVALPAPAPAAAVMRRGASA
jgi:PAS domain S-box-containing protein